MLGWPAITSRDSISADSVYGEEAQLESKAAPKVTLNSFMR